MSAVTGDRSLEWEASIGTEQLEADAKRIEQVFARITASANKESEAQVNFINRVSAAQTEGVKERIEAISMLREQMRILGEMKSTAPPDQQPQIGNAIAIADANLKSLLRTSNTVFPTLKREATATAKALEQIKAPTLTPAAGKTNTNVNAEAETQNQLQKELEATRIAYQKLKEENDKYRASTQAGKDELNRLRIAEKELNNQYKAGRIALVEYNLEQKKLVQAQKEAAKQQKENEIASKAALRANADQANKVKATLAQLEKEVDLLKKLQREHGIYAKGLASFGASANPEVIEKYNKKLAETARLIQQLTPRSTQATVTPNVDNAGVRKELNEQAKAVVRLGEGYKVTAEKQVGAIERVKARLMSLREAAATATPAALPGINKQIEVYSAELKRLNTVGTKAFEDTNNAGKKVEGTLNRLRAAALLYKNAAGSTTNIELQEKYNRKLQETEQLIKRTANRGKVGFDEMGNAIKRNTGGVSGFMNSLKGMAATLGVVFGVQQVIAWGKELIMVAAKAEGVKTAFAGIGNSATLDKLREATRGAVSDIDLMQRAMQAKNFNIAPELLAKGLEYAGKVARQTGIDVNYLSQSFVDGLGRQSLRVLDNLQISQVEMRKEIKETGDFQLAVSNILDRRLKEIGEVSLTSADRIAQIGAIYENVKEKIGTGILTIVNYDGLKEAQTAFYETGLEIKSLERNIIPLLGRYDELSAKAKANGGVTNLNKEEQRELKKSIQLIGDAIPSAITKFNEYGEAIEVGTDRVRDFHEQHKLVLQAVNEDRIKKTTERIADLREELDPLQKRLDELSRTGKITITETVNAPNSFGTGNLKSYTREASKNEQAEIIKSYREISNTLKQQEALLAADTGELLDKRADVIEAGGKTSTAAFDKLLVNVIGNFDELMKTAGNEEDLKKIQEAVQNRISSLAPTDKDINAFQEKLKKVNKVLQVYSIKGDTAAEKKANTDYQKFINERISLLVQIGKIEDEHSRKAMSREDEERQAITDKFSYLREQIEKFNKKVKGSLQIDVKILEPIEQKAQENLTARQEVDALKESIAEQKQLFEQFEQFKAEFGADKASKRFQGEIAEYENYLLYLKSLMPEESDQSVKAVQMREALEKEITAAEKEQQAAKDKVYRDALEASETYEAKRLAVIVKYARLENALRSEAPDADTPKRLQALALQKEAALDAVNDEAFEKTRIYRELNDNLIEYTKEQIKFQIAAIRQILDTAKGLTDAQRAALEEDIKSLQALAGNATPESPTAIGNVLRKEKSLKKQAALLKEAYTAEQLSTEEYRQQAIELAEIEQQLSNILNEKLKALSADAENVSKELAEWSALLAPIDEGLAHALGNASGLASAFVDALGAAASFASGDIMGGIKAAVSAIGKVLSINKQVKEMNAAARKEVSDFYEEAMRGEKEYQRLLRQRELDQVRRNKLTLEGIEAEQKALTKQALAVSNDYQTLFNDLMQQQYVKDSKYTHGTWFRKAKTEYEMASLAGMDYEQLEKLYLEGRLKDKAKEDFEELKKLKEELKAIGLTLKDLKDETDRMWTGTTSDAITDSIAQMFENGIPAAQELADSFEAMMKKAALNAFQFQYVEKQMQEFYKNFAEAAKSDGQLTADEIAKLRKEYEERMAALIKDFENLNAVTGMDPTDPNAPKQGALAGAIKGITADQADILAGSLNAMRISNIEIANGQKIVSSAVLESLVRMQAVAKGQNLLYGIGQEQLNIGQQQVALIHNGLAELRLIELNTRGIAVTNDYLKVTNERLSTMVSKMDSTNDILRANGG